MRFLIEVKKRFNVVSIMVSESTKFIKFVLQAIFPKRFVLGKVEGLKGLVLTFDDGPHPVHTPLILKELKKRDVKAIFFVLGSELSDYPELGRMIIEGGHLLGNHTFDHLNVKECSFKKYRESLEKTNDVLGNFISDTDLKLFRPPYSLFSVKLLFFILFSDYMLFNWTKDSRDSFIFSYEELIEYNRRIPVSNGDILLFHEDSLQTVEALPRLLDLFQEKGFQFILPKL